jgi:hypothetical protein
MSTDTLSISFFQSVELLWNPSLIASLSLFFCHPPELPDLPLLLQGVPCKCDSAYESCWHRMSINELVPSLMISESQLQACQSHFPLISLVDLEMKIRMWVDLLTKADVSALCLESAISSAPPMQRRPFTFIMIVPTLTLTFAHSQSVDSTFVSVAPIARASAESVKICFTINPDDAKLSSKLTGQALNVNFDSDSATLFSSIAPAQNWIDFQYLSPAASNASACSVFERPRSEISAFIHNCEVLSYFETLARFHHALT